MIDALLNTGLAVLDAEGLRRSQGRRVVVVGVARGGTSLVAGALSNLGVFMGDKSHAPVYEDVHLSEMLEKGQDEQALEIIQAYDQKAPVWGWKRPSVVNYLDKVDKLFERPLYIFIFKDVFSIANRNSISMLSDVVPSMKRALDQYQSMVDFLARVKPYAMLVSFEKAMANPEGLVDAIIDYAKLEVSEGQRKAAIDFVDPVPEKYLDNSRITKAHGRLGGVKDGAVYGWARYMHRKAIAEVEIALNGSVIRTIKANHPRQDMLDKFGEPCGFQCRLPEGVTLSPGDKLTARVVGEIRDLENSPLIIEDAE